MRYANYTTYDITVHNNFLKLIVKLQRDRHIEQKVKRQSVYSALLVFFVLSYATKLAISKILIMHSDVISCLIYISNKVEYPEKEERQTNSIKKVTSSF